MKFGKLVYIVCLLQRAKFGHDHFRGWVREPPKCNIAWTTVTMHAGLASAAPAIICHIICPATPC